MRTFDVDILIVPGWTGSGPEHWQTRWQRRLKQSRVVEQDDWNIVDKARWTQRLIEAVTAADRLVVLVAHSCGVPTVVHAAQDLPRGKVAGAFLVAPASEIETSRLPGMDPGFTTFPRDPLPFPSLLVASRSDPNCAFDDAGELALAWGSQLIDAGDVGHINTESGHGPWPEGALMFGQFLKRLERPT
jgi:predicted alpha/beta hydrolase family esterase